MYLSKIFNLNPLKSKAPQATKHAHGVFVVIKGKGILIVGKSGIGKSEVALDLIYRGNQLIADDSVEFFKQDKNLRTIFNDTEQFVRFFCFAIIMPGIFLSPFETFRRPK